MKAWQITEQNKLCLAEYNLPYEQDMVKVKITKTLLSLADIALITGKKNVELPIIPGRIALGLVSEASEESGLKKNNKVLVSPYRYDKSTKNYSLIGCTENGYLADYQLLPLDCVYPLPDGVSDESAILTDYIAFAIRILTALSIEKQEYIVVFGADLLGLLLCQLAIYYQTIPILIDKDEERLSKAHSFGVYYTSNTIKDVEKKILQFTSGKMADCMVFCTNNGYDVQQVLCSVKKNGKVALAGLGYPIAKQSLDVKTVWENNLTIVGVTDGRGDIDSALNLLANKVIATNDLLSEFINFDDVATYFESLDLSKVSTFNVIVNC